MRRLAVALLISGCTFAQDRASVTFYAAGGWFRGSGKAAVTLSTGKGDTASTSYIFDNSEKLAWLTPGKFLTVELKPGTHVLGATGSSKKPGEDEVLKVDLEPGKKYFFRMTRTRTGVYVVQSYRSHLMQVTCEDARSEADTTKPIDAKKVVKDKRHLLADSAYFPRCS